MIEDVAYQAALRERERFLDRLSRVATALRRLESSDYESAVGHVKGLPEEELVRRLARRLAQATLDHMRLEEALEDAGVDPESYGSAG